MPWGPLLHTSFRIKEKHSEAASLAGPQTPLAPLFQPAGVNREVSVCLWPCRKVVIFGWGLQLLFWASYVLCRSKGTEMAPGLLSLTPEHLLARATKNTFSLRGKGNTSWREEGVERKP